MDCHTRGRRFIIGGITLSLTAEATTTEEIQELEQRMELLSRALRGIATQEEELTIAQLPGAKTNSRTLVKILNGPTLDDRLQRKEAPPCGCRGKQP